MGAIQKSEQKLRKSKSPFHLKKKWWSCGKMRTCRHLRFKLVKLKFGDSGFSTDCGWEAVLSEAKNSVRAIGGNVLKITRHASPDAFSSCDRIQANVHRINEYVKIEKIKESKSTFVDST